MIANRFNPLGREKYYGDKTVIEVTVTDDDTAFAFGRYANWKYSVSGLQGHTEFTVDWGDGTSDTYTDLKYHNDNSRIYPQHTYPKGGKYIMTISNDLECFNFTNNLKVTRLIQWGKDVTYGCHFSYRASASLMSSFSGCKNLVGELPPYPKGMLDAFGTFNDCFNLTGSIPQWNESITNASFCYHGCSKLTGSIPQWNESITNASDCYYGCSNLTGSIPQWNESITNASNCYRGCSKLTGIWDATATDDEIMPSHITSFINCVVYASTALRAYFYTTWGGTKAVPTT